MEKILIASVSKNLVIGKNGKIPWHSKEEINYFKETTMGYPIIMGRKTFESIGKPLSGRINIVLTRNKHFLSNFPDVLIFHDLTEGINYCELEVKPEKVYIIGGGEIFLESIQIADRLSISIMNISSDGDTFFPEIDKTIWCEEYTSLYKDFKLILYKRCNK